MMTLWAMSLNPEITLGNLLTMSTMVGGLFSIWYRMSASVERLTEKQNEQATILKTIMDDRSAIQLLSQNLVHTGERITALGTRVDSYHHRLHEAEDRVHTLTTAQEVLTERIKRV